MVNEVAPDSILEIGCGEGYVLAALVDAGIPATLTGIDLSQTAVAHARTRLGDRAEVRTQDARALAEVSSTYDVVMMLEVLEHLDRPEEMLAVLSSLADRAVVLSVPREPWFRGANLLRLKNVRDFGNDPEHVNHWTKQGFRAFLAEHLDVREVVSPFPWTLVLATPRG